MRIYLIGLTILSSLTRATHLTSDYLDKVYDVMKQISTQSWENGTEAEAILQYKYPQYSVFSSSNPFPSSLSQGDFQDVFNIAQVTLNNRPSANNASANTTSASLLKDGAAGDPASLGISVLLANVSSGNAQVKGVGYGTAAEEELNYLLNDVPKSSSGAISHRADQVQLWSDSISMVPPFLAYYGAVHNNQSLLQLAYTQCALYRDVLRQDSGLWAHIVMGTGASDPGLWLTGNGWAAMGMIRVLNTIRWSGFSNSMTSQVSDLQSWVSEILTASQGYMTKDGLLRNYIDQSSSFEETAGSALIAAVALRMSTMGLTNQYASQGIQLLSAVSAKVNSSGYLTQVVNPYDWSQTATQSPEGQSFVIMAYSAYNEWISQGQQGDSDKNPLGNDSGALGGISRQYMGFVGFLTAVCAGVWTAL
ncbi:hypothetical protein M231_01851 [Tremella mesenterica]|uniref:Uncharacterized protein n=1 Tax=Tremella mesenterica TaxID=5217 RepID=A0A4Q1BSD3_TREME|nr:uncharacterized protein TREMEDRAFT_41567 [Tremella mesenterica DSM 1558]EIW72178.1 hypothetical protein TREMEDRAFT_41567 [Tremella mesenterica DSM 1558]RXK40792.1 hypothetical protein M231_01851 [Tremella mesenterica]